MSFEMLTELVHRGIEANVSRPSLSFLCRGLSVCLANLALQPVDLLHTQLVVQGEPKVYKTLQG